MSKLYDYFMKKPNGFYRMRRSDFDRLVMTIIIGLFLIGLYIHHRITMPWLY